MIVVVFRRRLDDGRPTRVVQSHLLLSLLLFLRHNFDGFLVSQPWRRRRRRSFSGSER
jgi:hypothetical protein